MVVGSWLDLFRSVYCDQVAPSGGECRPRGVYRGLRSPAAFARPDLSVDPAVFITAADARQLASSAGSRGERRPRGKHCGRRSPFSLLAGRRDGDTASTVGYYYRIRVRYSALVRGFEVWNNRLY